MTFFVCFVCFVVEYRFMPKWKLVIEYEGTRYRGWQEQVNARTVQGELRKASEAFLGNEVEIVGSGRTDAGVHALHQVAHLRSIKSVRAAHLKQEINDRLPADINVREAEEVPARFHARHHAEDATTCTRLPPSAAPLASILSGGLKTGLMSGP